MSRYRTALSAGMILGLLALLVMPLLVPQPAGAAETVTLYPSHDCHIDHDEPNTAHYTGVYLDLQPPGTESGVDYGKKPILQFDVTWGSTVPTGATITSAVLHLYYYSGHSSLAGNAIYADRMLRTGWQEQYTTWNNYDFLSTWHTEGAAGVEYDYTSAGSVAASLPSATGTWVTWAITTQVQWAQSNSEDVFVLVHRDDAWDDGAWWGYDASFASKEASGTTYDPYLTITYTPAVGVPTVSTLSATSVTETDATLRGYLDDDGGEACSMRVQLGYDTSYGFASSWFEGYTTGDTFYSYWGLTPGTLYHYRVQASNAAGTSSGSDKTFATLPYKPTYFTATAGDTEVSLTWTKGDGASKTMIRRSTSSYPTSPTSGTQVYFDTGTSKDDTGLTNGVTYYYAAWSWANDVYSTGKATDNSTPYAPTAPECTTNAATNVGDTSARLNMYLDDLNGAASADVSLQYYKAGDPEWGSNTTPTTYYAPGAHYADVSGLDAASTYFVRARAVSAYGTGYGAAMSFTTGGYSAPTMTTQAASGVMRTSATLNGKVTDDGGDDVTVWFQWGLSASSLGYDTASLSGLVTDDTFYYGLTGLTSNTQYFYRAVGENSEGTAYGTVLNFTTSLASAPTVRTDTATPGAHEADLKGTVLTDGGTECYVRFQWGATDSYGNNTTWVQGYTAGQVFTSLVTGLAYDTEYHYRAQAMNEGGTASGSDATVTTTFAAPSDFRAKALSHSTISLSWVKGGDQTLIRYSTDSYPLDITDGTQCYFGSGTSASASGLTAGSTYYFRAWSWREGNVWSEDYADDVATTLSVTPDTEDEDDEVVTPDTPGNWFLTPTGEGLSNMPFYDDVLRLADSLDIPHGTFWFGLSVLLMVIFGALAWKVTRQAKIGIAVASFVVIICTVLTMMPLAFLLVYFVLAGGITFVSQRT